MTAVCGGRDKGLRLEYDVGNDECGGNQTEWLRIMKVQVEYFAIYHELLHCSQEDVELEPGATVKDLFILKTSHLKAHEALLKSTLFAVNSEYEEGDFKLSEGDEVVFIPPVSGG